MDYLQEGIGLRAMAQKDPLVEYQKEGYDLFQGMMDAIKEESVGYLFHVDVSTGEPGEIDGEAELEEIEASDAGESREAIKVSAPGLAPSRAPVLEYSAPSEEADGTVTKVASVNPDGGEGALEYAGTPKNAPCPCGSGRKFKRCHGAGS
jgi:preprotein translocase subunit SecA